MGPDQTVDRTKAVVEATMARGVEQRGAPKTEEQQVGRAMNAAIDQGNPRGALRIATEPVVLGRTLGQKAEQIGVVRDEATGAKVRTPEEQARYDRLTTANELAQRFLKEGYDKLAPGEKTNLQQTVVDQINKSPLLAEKFRHMSARERNDYVLALLKDPKNSENIRTILDEISKTPDIADTVEDTSFKVAEQQIEVDARREALQAVTDRSGEITDALKPFQETGGVKGGKLIDLEKARNDLPNQQAEVTRLTQDVADQEGNLRRLERQFQLSQTRGYTGPPSSADILGQITNAESTLGTNKGNLSKATAEVTKLSNAITLLEQEKQGLDKQKTDSEIERRQADLELKRAELELIKRQRDFQNASSLRESQEMDLVDRSEGVFAESAVKLLNERVEQAEEQLDATLEELKNKAETAAEKAAIDAIEKRHKKVITRTRFGKTEHQIKIDKAKVDRDYTLLVSKGPEAYMKALLSGAINPDTGVAYTTDEAQALMENKDLMAKLQPEALRQLLAKRLMVGKISEGDAINISMSSWGKDMIDKALETRQDVRDTIAKLGGDVNNPGFMKRLYNEAGGPGILALILAGIVSVPVASAIAAARESGKPYA